MRNAISCLEFVCPAAFSFQFSSAAVLFNLTSGATNAFECLPWRSGTAVDGRVVGWQRWALRATDSRIAGELRFESACLHSRLEFGRVIVLILSTAISLLILLLILIQPVLITLLLVHFIFFHLYSFVISISNPCHTSVSSTSTGSFYF